MNDEVERESWERHTDSFRYQFPEGDPELWSQDEYEQAFDQFVDRVETWRCKQCSHPPFHSLRKARNHVESKHSERVYQKAEKLSGGDS